MHDFGSVFSILLQCQCHFRLAKSLKDREISCGCDRWRFWRAYIWQLRDLIEIQILQLKACSFSSFTEITCDFFLLIVRIYMTLPLCLYIATFNA